MRTRNLGGLEVSSIGMGCMGMSHAAGKPMDEREAINVIREAVDMGYTLFDTAKNYGFKEDPSHNEKLIGKALEGLRDKVKISTKCGVDFDYDVDAEVPPLLYDSSRKAIRTAVEGSLKRLNTDHIDIYFQARIDPKVEPEEVAETMSKLIKEGKILHWGISEVGEEYLSRAHAVCPVTAVENSYNMLRREHEDIIPFLEANNIGWIAHGPMFKGLLTGTFHKGTHFSRDDWRGRLVTDENLDRYSSLLEYLSELGETKNATPSQLSLAWILYRRPYIVPVPGMRSSARLKENAAAPDITLSDVELARIEELISSVQHAK